ncbi:unnamed protein product [Cuscuta europaea]|uniref:Uncharacterized protein n=1 Tax=Cuscuta europaea TaxID=41803 RepID=A0A9P1EIL3_CUSEU|nr:unnamed protein product [Cuscuta europaea]
MRLYSLQLRGGEFLSVNLKGERRRLAVEGGEFRRSISYAVAGRRGIVAEFRTWKIRQSEIWKFESDDGNQEMFVNAPKGEQQGERMSREELICLDSMTSV